MPLSTLSERGENRGAQSPHLVPGPQLLTAGAPCHLEISPRLDSNSSTKQMRSKLLCGQLPLCQVQKELAGQKSSGLITEKAACKQTQPKTPFHTAKFPFLLLCCWRVCPSIFLIFTAYYYTLISFRIKTEEAIAFYLLSTAMLLEIYYQLTTPQLQLLNNVSIHRSLQCFRTPQHNCSVSDTHNEPSLQLPATLTQVPACHPFPQ